MTTARNKLNAIYFGGAVVFSALLGGMTHSWLVFLLSLGVILTIATEEGSIR